jgi:hypothetical protein
MMPSVVEIPEGSYTMNDLGVALNNWSSSPEMLMMNAGSNLSGKLVVKEGIQIEYMACSGSHLKEVKLPTSIEFLIMSYLNSSELEKVTLSNPTSLKTVGNAFGGCTNIKEFVYNGDLNDIINVQGLEEILEMTCKEIYSSANFSIVQFNGEYYKIEQNSQTGMLIATKISQEQVNQMVLYDYNATGISKIFEKSYLGIEYIEFNNKRYKRKYNTSTHEITELEDLTGKVAVVLNLRWGTTDKNGECISFEPQNNTKWIDWADDLSKDNIILRNNWENSETSLKANIKTIGNSTESNESIFFQGTTVKILKNGEAINPTQEYVTEGVYIYDVDVVSEDPFDYETEFK